MYLFSYLIESYLYQNQHFNKRKNYLYLCGWAETMLEAGYLCPALQTCAEEPNVSQTKILFESIIKELQFPAINEKLLFRVALEEYRRGYFDSACEFLYYKPYIAEKWKFPYQIIYSGDDYTAKEIPDSDELENVAQLFIKQKST